MSRKDIREAEVEECIRRNIIESVEYNAYKRGDLKRRDESGATGG